MEIKRKIVVRVIHLSLFVTLLLSCNTGVIIEKRSVKEWERVSLDKINSCCSEFNESLSSMALNRIFKNDVRYKVLNFIELTSNDNTLQFKESYYNTNKKYFDILKDDGDFIQLIYDENKDSIYNAKKDVFALKEFEELVDDLKNSKIICCDFGASHPTISIYSSLTIKNGKIEVVETYSWE